MEDWRKDARREPIIVDLEALVPKDHLLRKVEVEHILNKASNNRMQQRRISPLGL